MILIAWAVSNTVYIDTTMAHFRHVGMILQIIETY